MAETIRIEIPIEVTDDTGAGVASAVNSLAKLAQAASKVEKSTSSSQRAVSKFDKAMEKTQRSMAAWLKEKYEIAMEVKDKVTPVLNMIKSGIKGIAGKAWSVTLRAKDFVTAPIRGALNMLKNPVVQAGAMLGVGIGVKDTVDTFKDFESAMSQVKAVSGATGTEFTQLTAKAKAMGASTKFTATESAEAFNYMSMAGWKTRDMLDGIEGIMSLAAASNEDLGTTSDIVTDALTAFGMKASQSGHFADVLAQAASSANTDVGMMGETFKYVGTMAGALGYSIEDVSLAAGLMANSGLKASMAGTSMNAIFTRLSTNTNGAADAIRELGVEFYNQDGSARKLSDVMTELRAATAGYTNEQKTNLANTVAGMEAQKGLLAILNATEQDYKNLTEAVNNADGAAGRMADTMLDNLAGSMTLLQSAADGVKLSLGERLKPYLMDLTEWLTDQMPNIEDGLMRFMDFVDSKVSALKEKISEFTGTDEWQDADFFGKVKIAWDEIIAEPFSEWWEGGGKIKLAGVARDIGTGLGTGISAGILALLGIDVSSTMDEASMVGKQFADGFAEGFQGVDLSGILGTAISGIFSSAGKFLPGGEAPDISSLLSVLAIGKAAGPLLNLGSGAFKIGKGIYNSATGGLLKSAIGSFSVEGELAGLGGLASGTGLMGLLGKTGMALGSGATTASGLALAGGGAIAGGLVGAGTLLSAGKNIYTAVTTDDNNERAANIGSAGLKLTGVGAGAALGATIGSVVPVLGTGVGALIGAGLGGLAGMFAGGKVEENYERQAEEAAKAAEAAEILGEKSKYAMEGAKFASKELQEAFDDSEVSVEQFASMMQKATSDKIKDAFGDMKLTAKEIKDIASGIVYGDNAEALTEFSKAASTAESSMQSLSDSISSVKKLNWKASLGIKFDDIDKQEYTAGVEALISDASKYLSDKHYEVKTAVDLLVESESATDILAGVNSVYAEMQGKIESLGGQLTAKVNVALEDGVITMDEQAEIENLQSQITSITERVSDAKAQAGFQSIKIKYSGAELSADTFASLHSELEVKAQEAADIYESALENSLSGLNLELSNAEAKLEAGEITIEGFNEVKESIQSQADAYKEGYQMHINQIAVDVGSFELGAISEIFEKNLDGILPEFEGSVTERLAQAMNKAAKAGVDMSSWSTGEGEGLASAVKWLGLDDLDAETQSAVAQMVGNLAKALPEQMGQLEDVGDMFSEMLASGVEKADLSAAAQAVSEKFGEGFGDMEIPEGGTGFQKGLEDMAVKAVEGLDLSHTLSGLNGKFGEAIETIESIDASGLTDVMTNSINSAAEGIEYGSVTSAVGSGISEAILATIGEIQGAVNELYGQVGAAINGAFAAGFQTTTTVMITADYQLANPTVTISFSGGGSGTATVSASIGSHASGGYVGSKQLSWLAEEGYGEFVIPTAPGRRARALELYEQAGQALGVGNHAEGGFVGNAYGLFPGKNEGRSHNMGESLMIAPIGDNEPTEGTYSVGSPAYYAAEDKEGGNGTSVQVNVQMSPEFTISGAGIQSEEDIMQVIRRHMKEMADELGGEIAGKLEEVFSNMPLKEA